MRFLAREAGRLGVPSPTAVHAVLDTLPLLQLVHGPLASHGLDEAAARLGVPVHGRHSALGDAPATAEIFVRLVPLLKKRGILTLGQAVDVTRQVDQVWPDAGARGT